ncbi:MAG: helix-turn-helix transcriptional regulator [Cyanobacteriota bacterium]|nr:helix-turn-helix transcriptional regulator [Cyanobacteriota bacterium]
MSSSVPSTTRRSTTESVPVRRSKRKRHSSRSKTLFSSPFFHAVIDGISDGILILSDRGEELYGNSQARVLCAQLSPARLSPAGIPEAVWRLCESLIESRELFPDRQWAIEDEVPLNPFTQLRLRVRWFQLADSEPPYLLVTLENCSEGIQTRALLDANKYGLTEREGEVWALRSCGCSYKDIAEQLYISDNTVKKHMKNINAKRKAIHWAQED